MSPSQNIMQTAQDIKKFLENCKYLMTFHFNLDDDGKGMIDLYACPNQYVIRYHIEYNKIVAKDFYSYKYERCGLISIPNINENKEYIVRRIADEIEQIYKRYIHELFNETRDILIQINELQRKFKEAKKRKIEEFSKELNDFDIAKFIETKLKIPATAITDEIKETMQD